MYMLLPLEHLLLKIQQMKNHSCFTDCNLMHLVILLAEFNIQLGQLRTRRYKTLFHPPSPKPLKKHLTEFDSLKSVESSPLLGWALCQDHTVMRTGGKRFQVRLIGKYAPDI